MSGAYHEPVLVNEVLHYLALGSGQVVVDATIGGGGHAEAVLSWTGPGGEMVGRLIGIDRDPEAIAESERRLRRFGSRVKLIQAGFEDLSEILRKEGMERVDGILFDLGASRRQLTEGGRGFSFQEEGPLDMRMDPTQGVSAGEMLNRLSLDSLTRLFREYGEEPKARGIARAVVERREQGRPIQTTRELAELVAKLSPRSKGQRLHPATRVFMALRIAVNDELMRLEKVLAQVPERLSPGGRAVWISYHSLEDRRVKEFLARESRSCICPPGQPVCTCSHTPRFRVLTRRPVRPGPAEIKRNPASRSAKLRAGERLEVVG